jgi:hypothetical protein
MKKGWWRKEGEVLRKKGVKGRGGNGERDTHTHTHTHTPLIILGD